MSWGKISYKGFGVREKSSATYGNQTSATYTTSLKRIMPVAGFRKKGIFKLHGFLKKLTP